MYYTGVYVLQFIGSPHHLIYRVEYFLPVGEDVLPSRVEYFLPCGEEVFYSINWVVGGSDKQQYKHPCVIHPPRRMYYSAGWWGQSELVVGTK